MSPRCFMLISLNFRAIRMASNAFIASPQSKGRITGLQRPGGAPDAPSNHQDRDARTIRYNTWLSRPERRVHFVSPVFSSELGRTRSEDVSAKKVIDPSRNDLLRPAVMIDAGHCTISSQDVREPGRIRCEHNLARWCRPNRVIHVADAVNSYDVQVQPVVPREKIARAL